MVRCDDFTAFIEPHGRGLILDEAENCWVKSGPQRAMLQITRDAPVRRAFVHLLYGSKYINKAATAVDIAGLLPHTQAEFRVLY